MKKLVKVLAAALVLTIAAFPAMATADTTVDVTKAGAPTTAIESGDTIRVSAGSPISTSGSINQTLAATWSKESLRLGDTGSIMLPEGWTLEYTTDNENWSATAPGDLSTVTGIRAVGDVTTNGRNTFTTKANSQVVATQDNFQGSSGGDGYALTFGADRVYNVFHHDGSLRVDCHVKATGASCYGGATQFLGFTTGNASEAFWDSSRSALWALARNSSTGQGGFACVDYSDKPNPKLCATNFVALGAVNTAQELGVSTRIGNKVYVINEADWKLLCLDISTGAACTNNGFQLPGTPAPGDKTLYGRVASAGDFKVYFSTTSHIGCYNPTTNDFCGAPVALGQAGGQYPMFPVRNDERDLIGMCFFRTQQCLDGNGLEVNVLPAALSTWMTNNPVPNWNTYNAGNWAEQNNKIYLNDGPSGTASPDVYCFDYTTGDACAGFSGRNVGVRIYVIVADPSIPNCLWTNGDAGQITTFNGTTGLPGCSLEYPVVEMPYTAVAPRLACSESGRVLTWETIQFDIPDGIEASDLNVTILDSDGAPIPGWVDLSPNANGLLSMQSLTVETTGTKPTIQVNAGVVDEALLAQLTATVKFEAEDPELCFDLVAAPNCPEFVPGAGDLTVPDGLIQTAAITYSADGEALAAGDAEVTLSGTNTDDVCAASIARLALPEINQEESGGSDLADTGADSGLMLMAVFALFMSIGGGLLIRQAKR